MRSSFSGRLWYVMAVVASAIGLGIIWRFPYLAAKYGGGIFIIVYLILMITFGYVLVLSETSIGRMTKKSPVGAFTAFGRGIGYKFGGWINAIVPMIIVPYYSVIGGWVARYLYGYLRGDSVEMAGDVYFGAQISSSFDASMWFILFVIGTFVVIIAGVRKGIERLNKVMMPMLLILGIFISVYSVTRPGALEGVKYMLIPDFANFTIKTVVAAMGQLFFSLSLAMGILYTYGSYIDRSVDMEKTTKQIEVLDFTIAMLAGFMIIPAVFAFSGGDPNVLTAGPSLMFITMPKVFHSMAGGGIIGTAFFLLVLIAALTSAISLLETCVSTVQDQSGWSRGKSIVVMFFVVILLGIPTCLGFGVWDMVTVAGMGLLDFFDFLSNSIMMPIAALCTCILVIKGIGMDKMVEEIKFSSAFKWEKLYRFCIRFLAPVTLVIILLSAIFIKF